MKSVAFTNSDASNLSFRSVITGVPLLRIFLPASSTIVKEVDRHRRVARFAITNDKNIQNLAYAPGMSSEVHPSSSLLVLGLEKSMSTNLSSPIVFLGVVECTGIFC